MGDETNSPTTEWTPEDYARAERERRRYEIARDVLAGTASMPQGTWAEKAKDAVSAADALLAALEADRG